MTIWEINYNCINSLEKKGSKYLSSKNYIMTDSVIGSALTVEQQWVQQAEQWQAAPVTAPVEASTPSTMVQPPVTPNQAFWVKDVQEHLPQKKVASQALTPEMEIAIVEQSWWDLLKANQLTQQIASLRVGKMMWDESILAMLKKQSANEKIMQGQWEAIQHERIEPVVKQDKMDQILNDLESLITTPQQANDAWRLAAQAAQQEGPTPGTTASEEGATTEANVDQPTSQDGWEQEQVEANWEQTVLSPEILASINELVKETANLRMNNLSLQQEKEALIQRNQELLGEQVSNERKYSLNNEEAEFIAISRRYIDNPNAVTENELLNWIDRTFSSLGMDTKGFIADFVAKKWIPSQPVYTTKQKRGKVLDFLPGGKS